MLKKIFLVISILVLLVFGIQIFDAYLANHLYYLTGAAGKGAMITSVSNWKILMSGILFSLIPSLYIIYSKRKSWKLIFGSFFLGLCLFGLSFTLAKGALGSGFFKLIFNFFIIFGLGVFMMSAFTHIGDTMKQKVFGLETHGMFDVLLSLGVGLSTFLVTNYVLILFGIFHPVVTRSMLLGSLVFMRRQKDSLEGLGKIILKTFDFRGTSSWITYFLLVLLVCSVMYFYNGFLLSDIAYSTARDANHAYMFYPKMRALNYGYYRNEINMALSPQLRYSFIAFWFSLFEPFGGFAGISMDTFAIEMNFWSGIFVLIFGLGLISEIVGFMGVSSTKQKDLSLLLLGLGWLLLLLWLTSGMGAFLVFIDNKTDLGVFALIILAIYSGIVALRSINDSVLDEKTDNSSTLGDSPVGEKSGMTSLQRNLLMLSGGFYAIAGVAKATALFDVINFGLFLSWIWIGGLGVIGVVLLTIGGMSIIKFRGIEGYISEHMGKRISYAGVGGIVIQVIQIYLQKTRKYTRYILVRAFSFICIYVLLKAPFWIARTVIYDVDISPGKLVEKILFGSTGSNKKSNRGLRTSERIPLYAQSGGGSLQKNTTCTLAGQGFSSIDELYANTKSAPGNTYNEDVGRYVGFGRKGNTNDQKRRIFPFVNPWRGFLFSDGCSSFNPFNPSAKKAKILCEREDDWRTFDSERLLSLQKEFDEGTEMYTELGILLMGAKESTDLKQLTSTHVESLNKIEAYMQGNTVKVVNENGTRTFYLPYRFLNPFNITFNRSLQNLSSYYTDIGAIWLILMLFNIIGLIYGIISKNRILTGLEIVTVFGRLLWFFIGGGILWYAIGIIIWSIMSFVVFVGSLYGDEDELVALGSWVFLGLFGLFGFFQLFLNFMRISSQGGQGAFMRYKSNTGIQKIYDEKLQSKSIVDRSFGSEDIFNLQFPHYKAFIESMNASTKEEGALIAGTYARYFVEDQTNIKYDQFLTWLWKQTSDGDVCNSYLRLKKSNKKYIVIDPNIGTVVQGAGNQSLFHRFFAKVDTTTGTVVEDGVMSMLVKMLEAGYLRFHSSNNIGSVYAFNLPNTTFGNISDERRVVERARMSVPRFWNPQQILSVISQVADQRIKDGGFLEDLSFMLGKSSSVDIDTLKTVISKQLSPQTIATLSQDERLVLAQFLQLRNMSEQNPDQYKKGLQDMISKNIKSGSQIIVLEVL